VTRRRRPESPWVGDYREHAAFYEAARPSYPDALIDRLVARAGVKPGDRVAEVGSGTGIFTRVLAGRGFEITGLEPDAAMRALAPDLPGVTWCDGRFESLGLGDGSQRWIVAAQSFQRADRPRALPEIRRCLGPGGHFSVVHYTLPQAENDVVSTTSALLRRHVPEYHNPDRASPLRRRVSRVYAALPATAQRALYRAANALGRPDLTSAGGAIVFSGDFERALYDEACQRLRFDRDAYLALWSSRSRLAAIGGARFESFMKDLERMLVERRIDEIEVSCVYGAWTARVARGS